MTNTNQTVLILGGTGKTGRRVAQRLIARGTPVRIGSRSGDPPFEWNDPKTWSEPLLRDVRAVYIAYSPDVAAPSALEHLRGFSRHAVNQGIKRIVLFSGRGEPTAATTEDAVRACGAEVTVLRSAFLFQNFSEGFFIEGVLGGEVAFPAGEVLEPFIDADDVADVAVSALTEPAQTRVTHELTGPRLLTFAAAIAEISAAIGRPLSYRPVSSDDYARVLREHLPPELVTFLIELFRGVLDGHNSYTTDGVKRVLGRPARDIRDYARDAASAKAWG